MFKADGKECPGHRAAKWLRTTVKSLAAYVQGEDNRLPIYVCNMLFAAEICCFALY